MCVCVAVLLVPCGFAFVPPPFRVGGSVGWSVGWRIAFFSFSCLRHILSRCFLVCVCVRCVVRIGPSDGTFHSHTSAEFAWQLGDRAWGNTVISFGRTLDLDRQNERNVTWTCNCSINDLSLPLDRPPPLVPLVPPQQLAPLSSLSSPLLLLPPQLRQHCQVLRSHHS